LEELVTLTASRESRASAALRLLNVGIGEETKFTISLTILSLCFKIGIIAQLRPLFLSFDFLTLRRTIPIVKSIEGSQGSRRKTFLFHIIPLFIHLLLLLRGLLLRNVEDIAVRFLKIRTVLLPEGR
jgi:hypothetical protein